MPTLNSVDERDDDNKGSGSNASSDETPSMRPRSSTEYKKRSEGSTRTRHRVSSWDSPTERVPGGGGRSRRGGGGGGGVNGAARLSAADRIRSRRSRATVLEPNTIAERWRFLRYVIAISIILLTVMATGSVAYFFGLLKFTAIDAKKLPPFVDFLVATCIFLQFWTCLFLLVKYGVRLVWQHLAGRRQHLAESGRGGLGSSRSGGDGGESGAYVAVNVGKPSDYDDVIDGDGEFSSLSPRERWGKKGTISRMSSGQPSSEAGGGSNSTKSTRDAEDDLPV